MPKPGTILMYSAALLPTWAKFDSSLVVNANAFSPESIATIAVSSALTSTVTLAAPMVSATLTLRFSPPPKAMLSALYVLKPVASTVKEYVPTGTEANVKYPSPLLTVSRVEPDTASFTTTLALATTDPDGSDTTPVRVAKIP